MGTTSRGYIYADSTSDVQLWTHFQNLATSVNTDVQAGLGSAWIDFSGSFTITSSVNPTKGASTYTTRYRKLNDHTVLATYRLIIGAGFVAGSGLYFFSLPVAPADADGYGALGGLYILDNGTAEFLGITRLSGSKLIAQYSAPSATFVQSAAPIVWATGDEIRMSITYEI